MGVGWGRHGHIFGVFSLTEKAPFFSDITNYGFPEYISKHPQPIWAKWDITWKGSLALLHYSMEQNYKVPASLQYPQRQYSFVKSGASLGSQEMI